MTDELQASGQRPAPLPAASLSRRMLLSLAATAPFAASLLSRSPARAADEPAPAGASSFTSVTPSRLADTRPEQGVGGYTRLDANTIRVQVSGRGGVPVAATTAVLNITVVDTVLPGYVTVYPAGQARPVASNVNVEKAGQVLANLVTVRLGAGGAVDIYSQSASVNLVVDVNGAYVPTAVAVAAGRFVGLNTAVRVLDTRTRGYGVPGTYTERVNVGLVVPATATSVVVNLTVTDSNASGYWTAFPAGAIRPQSSSVNTDAFGQTRANQAILPIGTVNGMRAIDVYSLSGGNLVVDVAGYFTGASDVVSTVGLFMPNSPYRTMDTRFDARYGNLYPGWIVEFVFTGQAQAQAVVVNLTTTETRAAGYFTGYPARTVAPLASNLNASYKNQTIANHAILRCSTVGVAVFTQSGGQLIVDVAGYFLGTPAAAVLPAPVNVVPPPPPPPPPAPLPYTLQIPKIGVTGRVLEGVTNNIVNNGYVGHWPGTGFADEQSHMVMFAHRTSYGGIFRNLHLLGPGDTMRLVAADGRVFNYAYNRRAITGSSSTAIYNVGLAAPLPSVSLVACSKTNYLPTDVKYRIVITFSLVD